MPHLARSSVLSALGLALMCSLPVGSRTARGDAPAGPSLVLPSPVFASRFFPEDVNANPAPDNPEPNGLQEPEMPQVSGRPDGNVLQGGFTDQADEVEVDEAEVGQDDVPDVVESPRMRRELSPAMAAFRDQVRRTLAAQQAQVLSTADNTVTEVLYACRGFGCHAEVLEAVTLRKKLNGITCLTWNYPCAGFAPLTISDGHITGRIGYGYQEYPGELIAALALARVQPSYPVRVGEEVRTVADLVEYEKLACREGTDKSLSLIGLMYYAGKGPAWHNRLGEEWSIERILKEELEQPVVGAPWGGTQRLMGLSYAVRRQAERNRPIEGQYRRAQDYIARFHGHAFSLQNENGSWSPYYLAARGVSKDPAAILAATGRILEWLVFSLPEERLEEPGVVRAVHFVNQMLSSGRYAQNVKSLRTEEIGAVMHALAGLRYYDDRFFKAADPPAAPPAALPGTAPVAPSAAQPAGLGASQ